MSLPAYLGEVAASIARQDGRTLRHLMDIRNGAALAAVKQRTAGRGASWDPTPDVRSALSRVPGAASTPEWTDALALHATALAASAEGRARDAYDALSEAVPPFLKLFRDAPDAWLVEPLVGLAGSLRLAAAAADAAGGNAAGPRPGSAGGGGGGASTKALESCGAVLQRCFAAAMQGGGPAPGPGAASGRPSKKAAALPIVVTLFRIYFALNTLRLCKNLIAAVNSRQFPPLESFPRGQVVAYQYFTGRLALFDEDYDAADAALGAAFDGCPPAARANRAKCAYYLIPVRLLRGVLPSGALLDAYGLRDEYGAVVDAVRTGSVSGLDKALQDKQWAFIQAGTYLLLDKLRAAVARRLIKRVALLHAAADPAKAAQLPLSRVAAALAWQGAPSDPDAVECLVANLIFRRYVKGYIAHKSGVLVLSKAEPFPSLSGVALADPV